jgi:hypothetical protein
MSALYHLLDDRDLQYDLTTLLCHGQLHQHSAEGQAACGTPRVGLRRLRSARGRTSRNIRTTATPTWLGPPQAGLGQPRRQAERRAVKMLFRPDGRSAG